tara:strand:+ start:703 stop:1164 length:462 start_codon:yes stop_codon:yes gene_type:complete
MTKTNTKLNNKETTSNEMVFTEGFETLMNINFPTWLREGEQDMVQNDIGYFLQNIITSIEYTKEFFYSKKSKGIMNMKYWLDKYDQINDIEDPQRKNELLETIGEDPNYIASRQINEVCTQLIHQAKVAYEVVKGEAYKSQPKKETTKDRYSV